MISARVFARKGTEKDERAKEIEDSRAPEVREGHGGRDQDRARRRVRPHLAHPDRTEDDREAGRRPGPRAARQGRLHHRGEPAAGAAQAARRDRDRRQERRDQGRARRHAGDGHRDRGAVPGEDREADARRRAAAGRDQDGEGVRRHQAEAPGRRQDGGSSRQQGCGQPHPAARGHAVLAERHAGRRGAEPARRSEPHERRSGARGPLRLGAVTCSARRSRSSSTRRTWAARRCARSSPRSSARRRPRS